MKKNKMKTKDIISVMIRALFFFLFPAMFSTAFSGVKYLCAQMAAGDGFELNGFLIAFLVTVMLTVVFGRFFCGYVCAFGTYGDALYWVSSAIRKKFRKKAMRLPSAVGKVFRYGKYIVLCLILFFCFLGKETFISGLSPWMVFSRLETLKSPQGGWSLAVLLFILLSAAMLFEPRFFCRFFCPLGAIFSLLPVLPCSSVKRDRPKCIHGCNMCRNKCPADLEIQDSTKADSPLMGECFSCGKCIGVCPKKNVHGLGLGRDGGRIPMLILKALLFMVVCYFLMKL